MISLGSLLLVVFMLQVKRSDRGLIWRVRIFKFWAVFNGAWYIWAGRSKEKDAFKFLGFYNSSNSFSPLHSHWPHWRGCFSRLGSNYSCPPPPCKDFDALVVVVYGTRHCILGCLFKLKEAGEGLQVLVCGSPAGRAVLPVLTSTQGLRYAQAALHPAEQFLVQGSTLFLAIFCTVGHMSCARPTEPFLGHLKCRSALAGILSANQSIL